MELIGMLLLAALVLGGMAVAFHVVWMTVAAIALLLVVAVGGFIAMSWIP